MDIKVKLILDSNPDYKRYLRSNSYWYKTLMRNPEMMDVFVSEVKEKYKLRTTDKINNFIDKIDMVSLPNDYDRWIAHFVSINNNTPNDLYKYLNNYDIWQYTSSGRINGITTSVDMNVSYKKY